MGKIKNSRPLRAGKLLVVNFYKHNVAKNAAALAYFLLFALFPILIFVSNLLGMLDLNIYAVTNSLSRLLPMGVVEIIESFLDHVSNASSGVLLWFSLVFSIWFPLRAVMGLMDDVRRAYGLVRPKRPILYIIWQVICTVVFLVAIALTLVLSVMGENVLGYLFGILSDNVPDIPESLIGAWHYLRFLLMGLFALSAIGMLYSVALEGKVPLRQLFPGMIIAMVSWIVVSIGFSFYAENFANYSLIYGALGAVIVLLVWLYLTAMILILGGEVNAALYHTRKGVEPVLEQGE